MISSLSEAKYRKNAPAISPIIVVRTAYCIYFEWHRRKQCPALTARSNIPKTIRKLFDI